MTDEELFEELLESDQGDPDVQYQLGCCYLRGRGVEQDGRQAERWLRRAAEQGHSAAWELLNTGKTEPEGRPAELTAQTLPDWCLAAENGDVDAQYRVAMYFLEQDVAGGSADAERYLAMAVDQGHPQACLTLAKRRQGQERYEEAVALLKNAADCGLTEAMGLLAVCYGRGQGTEKDSGEAELWFNRAADLGGAEEKLALALRYKTGDLVPVSPARALSWLRRAQDAGMADAEERFYAEERAREARERELEERYQQLMAQGAYKAVEAAVQMAGEDAPLALRVLRTLAEQGHAYAQNELGVWYANGHGVERDYAQAVAWFRKAAEQGYKLAQSNLGRCYYNGRGVEQDYAQAVEWCRKAAEQGHAWAQNSLGFCYKNGQGVEQDCAQAVEWYRKAAEQGLAEAQNNLGVCYDRGQGVEQNFAQATRWYHKAAEQGNMWAQCNLGICYQEGQGVERDFAQAEEWYRKAAEQGHQGAAEALEKLSEEKTRMEEAERERQRQAEEQERHEEWLRQKAEWEQQEKQRQEQNQEQERQATEQKQRKVKGNSAILLAFETILLGITFYVGKSYNTFCDVLFLCNIALICLTFYMHVKKPSSMGDSMALFCWELGLVAAAIYAFFM